MTEQERQRIEDALKQAEIQEQQNQNLIRIIQRTDAKDLENERFNNMSNDERRILGRKD